MKSLVFYLIWIALFLAGTKLVCRQQQYIRSIQALAQAKPTPITGLQQPSQSTQVSAGPDRTTPSGLPGIGSYHKRITGRELTNAEKPDDTPDESFPFSGHYLHVLH